MAKINILFNDVEYAIDEANLAPAADALKAHLETLGSGESGTLEYDKEAQFKEVITLADFEAYVSAGAEAMGIKETSKQYMFFADAEVSYPACIVEIANDYSWAFLMFITAEMPAPTYIYRIGEGEGQFSLEGMDGDGWYYNEDGGSTVTKSTAPTAVIPQDAVMSADLETTAIFFDLGGSSGDLDITLDGAVYKVDSTKLAPATDSFIAHLETLKGGEGGTLEYGKEVKFKKVITAEDCQAYIAKAGSPEAVAGADTYFLGCRYFLMVYNLGDTVAYYLHWEDPAAPLYAIGLQAVNPSMPVDGWWLMSASGEYTSAEPPTVIFDENESLKMSADLETTAIFFDLGGGSGEVTETITADSDFLVEDIAFAFGLGSMYRISCPINDLSTDNISLGAQGKPLKIDDAIHFHLVFNNGAPAEDIYTNNIADDSELNIRLLEIFPALATAQYLACAILVPNNIEEIFTSFGKPELFDRFKNVYAPNTILIPRYIFEERDGVENPLETLTVTYSNGTSTGGDLAITINGVEYLVDSAKLADAKRALAAHLKALEQGSVNLIAFTIDGTEYEAEDGMTWAEWVESEYNTDGFVLHSGSVCTDTLNYMVDITGGSSATITEGTNYSMSPYGGGN